MKKSSRGRREQPHLNLDLPVETEETYSLEDILNEFGGWSKQPEAEPADVSEPDVQPSETLYVREEAPAEQEEPVREADTEPELPVQPSDVADPAENTAASAPQPPETEAADREAGERQPPRFQFVRMEDLPKKPAPAAEAVLPQAQPVRKRERQPAAPKTPRRPRREAARHAPAEPAKKTRPAASARPVPPPPSAEELYQAACRQTKGLLLRRRLTLVLCLLAVAVTACCHLHVALGSFVLQTPLASQILLVLLVLGMLSAGDVLVDGVRQALRLRPGLETLVTVAGVVFLINGILELGAEERLPNTAMLLLSLFFAMWGKVLSNRARRRSLKAALSMEEHPLAAVLCRRAWGSRDCVFRSQGDRAQYVTELETPGVVERTMGVYAPLVFCLSLILSVLMHLLRERDFLSCWAAMLAGAIPVASFITFWRPFSALAGRLLRSGAALAGWRGARLLASPCCIAVGDSDLFSKSNVTMNGMKVFGEFNVSQVVGYTYAVLSAAECGLEPVFHDVFVNQNGRSYVIDGFKRYESGGFGAEIQGEVVLVGSIGFMQLMGVRMPEGTNVRQAVYCAVNGTLAAIFAIHYNPSAAVHSGLQLTLRSKGLSLLLATRDFILTPAMVRHKYKIPSDCMEYPTVEERFRLSGPLAAAGGQQAALLARDSFLPLAESVAGGHSLCASVWAGLCVNLLGGILGFAITAVLSWLGAFAAASAFNLMLFALLWTLPVMLLTSIAGK